MKTVLLDSKYFDMDSPLSEGLFSGILKLFNRGFRISVNNPDAVDPKILQLLSRENIKLVAFDADFSADVVLNPDCNLSAGASVDQFLRSLRSSVLTRKSKETDIHVSVTLDGPGSGIISTGIGFFDHMLEQIARHANIHLSVDVKGDLHVDEHHTVEDVGIVLGTALAEALGDKKGIRRYGYYLPMDDSIAVCALDLGGRSYLKFKCKFEREKVGSFPTELVEEFFRGLASGLKANIFIKAKGKNDHHKIEAIFKSFAKSLNEACRFDERSENTLPSTKGLL